MKTTKLEIEGMTCGGCAASAHQALQSVPGVVAVQVDLPEGRATVEHDEQVDDQRLVAAVADSGFEATVEVSEAI